MNKPQISNADVREEIKKRGLFLWQVAIKAGVSEATLNRWLRTELTDEQKERVLEGIERAIKEF